MPTYFVRTGTWRRFASDRRADRNTGTSTRGMRSHQGYRLGGRTPARTLQEALGLTDLPPLVPAEGEEVKMPQLNIPAEPHALTSGGIQ